MCGDRIDKQCSHRSLQIRLIPERPEQIRFLIVRIRNFPLKTDKKRIKAHRSFDLSICKDDKYAEF